MTSAQNCGSVGQNGPCCKAYGHAGPHARPMLAWDEWGGICGAISSSGAKGEPLACAFQPQHDGPHAWATLPTFTKESR